MRPVQSEKPGIRREWFQGLLSRVAASLRRDWPLHLIFLVLLTLWLYAFACHEVWRDEAHYFLRVRDAASFWDMLQGIRYERSLALWPSMLYGLKLVGLTSISAMQAMHFSLSVLLLGVLIYGLRPIPLFIRGLMGASYILMYEYTAISRSYGLTTLLLGIFLLLELRGNRNTIWKAITLLLMALTNINGLILAIALTTYLFIKLQQEKSEGRLWLVGIVGAGILFSVYMAWSPADMYEPRLLDYRASALAALGIPRAITTIGHITTGGFFYLPQVTSGSWWGSPSALEHLFLADYRTAYVVGILAASVALWLLLRLFKAHVGLGLAATILWAANLALFAVIHPGDIRHMGILVLGTLALFALTKCKDRQISLGQIGKILLYAVLITQAVSGIWALYAEGTQTFSQGRNVAEWLKANYPDESPIIYPDYSGITIAAYTGGHFLALESGKQISYVQMDRERSKTVPPTLVNDVKLDKEGQLLITDFPFEPRVIDGRITVEPLHSFGPAIERPEGNYHIYRIRPQTDAVWQAKFVPSKPSYTEGSPEVKYNADEDTLTITTSGAELATSSYPEDRFNNSVGTTVEINMKLIEGPNTHHDASMLHLQDGTRGGKICFFEDRIEIRDQNLLKATHYMDTTDGFHSYRLTVFQDSFNVYVDGELVSSITLAGPASKKVILFGDWSKRRGENFSMCVQYIAYSAKGAIAPER